MRYSISDTAEYGDLTRGPRVINDAVRAEMGAILADIRDGSFAEEWIAENRNGRPELHTSCASGGPGPPDREGGCGAAGDDAVHRPGAPAGAGRLGGLSGHRAAVTEVRLPPAGGQRRRQEPAVDGGPRRAVRVARVLRGRHLHPERQRGLRLFEVGPRRCPRGVHRGGLRRETSPVLRTAAEMAKVVAAHPFRTPTRPSCTSASSARGRQRPRCQPSSPRGSCPSASSSRAGSSISTCRREWPARSCRAISNDGSCSR